MMMIYLFFNFFLFFSSKFFQWVGSQQRHLAILGVIAAMMSVQGIANLQQQRSILGEFSNVHLEQLVDWINLKTDTSESIVVHFKLLSIQCL